MRFLPMTCLFLTINLIHAQNLQGYQSGETQNREKRHNIYRYLQHLLASSSSNFENNYKNDFPPFSSPFFQNQGHDRLVVNVNQPDSNPTTIINNLHPEYLSTCPCERYVRAQNGELQCLCPKKQIFTKCTQNTVCVLRSVCQHGLLFDTQYIPQGYNSQSDLCNESTHVCCTPPTEVRKQDEYGERQIYNHFVNSSIEHLNNTVNKYVITGNVYVNNGNPTTQLTTKYEEKVKFNVQNPNNQQGNLPSQLPSAPQGVSLSAQPQEEINPQYFVQPQKAEMNPQYSVQPQVAEMNYQYPVAPQTSELNTQFPAAQQTPELNSQFPNSPQISELNSQFSAAGQGSGLNSQFSAAGQDERLNSQFSAIGQDAGLNSQFSNAGQDAQLNSQFSAAGQEAGFNSQLSTTGQDAELNPQFPTQPLITQLNSQFPVPENSVPASTGEKNLVQLNLNPSSTTSERPSSFHTIPPNLVRPTRPTTTETMFESKIKEDQQNSLQGNNGNIFTNEITTFRPSTTNVPVIPEVTTDSLSDLLQPNEVLSIFGTPNQPRVNKPDTTVFPGLANPDLVVGGLNLQANLNEIPDTTVGVSIIENVPITQLSQMDFPQSSLQVPMKKPDVFLSGKIEKLRNTTRTNTTTASQITQGIGIRIFKEETQPTKVFPTHAPAFNQVTGQSFNFQEPTYVPPDNTPSSFAASTNTNTILRVCPSSMKCVQDMYCTPEGLVSTVPVILSPEEEIRKNLLLTCGDESAGQIGKCCFDRNA